MRSFSATDSVSVAVHRTRDFLFRPFSWGTFLKLGLVAIITEGWGTNSSSSKSSRTSSGSGPFINSPFDIPAAKVAMIVASILFVFAVVALLYYLVTRLRFAFFHCLVHNTKEIRPGWRIYREPATRFFWLSVMVGICYLMLVVLIALPFISGFMRLFREMPPGGHPDFGLLLSLLLPLIPVIILLALIAFLADLVLRDWMLPHYALENATAGEAWGWVWRSIANEKKEFFVYVLLRVVLPIVAMIGLFVVLLIPGLVLAGTIGAIVYAIHTSFAASTGASAFVGILLQVFFGAVAFFFLLLFSICLGGPISTWVREYAITFYGGRYQTLGDILYPPVAGD
jgi:hypothetical protein